MTQDTYVTQEQFSKALNRIETLETKVEEKDERIEQLETDVERLSTLGEGAMEQIKSLKGTVNGVEENVTELKEDVEHQTPTPQGPQTPLHDTTTPLMEVCGITEREAETELSKNMKYARDIAMDAFQIGEDTEGGVVIEYSQLRTELTKAKGSRPHKMDLKRTRDFLDDMGGEHVTVVENRGKKLVVFDKAYAKRLGTEVYGTDDCLVLQFPNSWRNMVESRPCRDHDTKASVPA